MRTGYLAAVVSCHQLLDQLIVFVALLRPQVQVGQITEVDVLLLVLKGFPLGGQKGP